MSWICANYPECDSYVGCHRNSRRPLGRLANKELRKWKLSAHAAFDPLWKRGLMGRNEAYRWLAAQLKIKVHKCHVGMFDVETCKRVVELSRGYKSMQEHYHVET